MNRKDRRASRAKAGPGTGSARPDSGTVPALLQQGIAHHQNGNLAGAAAAYEKILAIHRDNADALNLLGLTHHQRGDNRRALELIERALRIAPGNKLIQNNIGIVLQALDRHDDAREHFRRAVALDPDYVQACINLGNAQAETGESDDAIATFTAILRRAPGNAEVHGAFGLALTGMGEIEQAGQHFRRAVALAPNAPIPHYLLGNHHYHGDDDAGAIREFREAVSLNPGYGEAWSLLGLALRRAGQPEDAIEALQSALKLRPDDANSLVCLAAAYRDLRRIDDAHDTIGRSLQRDPDLAEAHNEHAYILRCLGQQNDAIEAYSRAYALDPDRQHAIANRAHVYLAEGRFEEGWRDYLLDRAGARGRSRCFEGRLPDDLSGKRVLLVRDQGLGDQIFFLRFAAALKGRGAFITFLSHPKISGLVERVAEIDSVIDDAQGTAAPEVDYRILVSDLPYALGMTQPDRIPPALSIPVASDRAARMREKLAALGPPPYIGVTWRAGVQEFNALSKEVPLEAMAEALKNIAGTVIVLQRNPLADEIGRFSNRLGRMAHDMTALNDDLEEMLALLGELDDYVCVSNTNIHLRAARGRPSRVCVPYPAEFRWMNRGDESPWFPGTRLYRQTHRSGWNSALAALATDLAAAYSGR